MTFLDTNVLMYAVGRSHPRREKARDGLRPALEGDLHLVTSAEVLRELLHAYLSVSRTQSLDHLVNLAVCRRREVRRIRTFDRAFRNAFDD